MRIATADLFDDETRADTTFGQSSNAYDSAAMTRSLNIESTQQTIGDGSAYGPTVHSAFRAMRVMRWGSLRATQSNDFHRIPDIARNTIRRGWTPPNTPRLLHRGGPDPWTARPGPEGRR
jgi:hypothetical protein